MLSPRAETLMKPGSHSVRVFNVSNGMSDVYEGKDLNIMSRIIGAMPFDRDNIHIMFKDRFSIFSISIINIQECADLLHILEDINSNIDNIIDHNGKRFEVSYSCPEYAMYRDWGQRRDSMYVSFCKVEGAPSSPILNITHRGRDPLYRDMYSHCWLPISVFYINDIINVLNSVLKKLKKDARERSKNART